MTKWMNKGLLLAAAFCAMMISNSAEARCPSDNNAGTWIVSGSAAAFSGPNNNPYYLSAVRVSASCVYKRVCELNDRGKPVCTYQYVDLVPTMSVGEWYPSFDGSGNISYWGAVNSNQGGEGWIYADSTIEGNYTRVWFRWNNGAPQVVFEVWKNGVYQNPEWRNVVRG